jgi:hypothetical protein
VSKSRGGIVWSGLRLTSLIAALAFVGVVSVAPAQADPPGGGWHVAFEDEFEGSALNTNVWSPTFPAGSVSGKCVSPNQVSVGGGRLHLKLATTKISCPGVSTPTLGGATIDSVPGPGRQGKTYTFGYVEWKVYVSGPQSATSADGSSCTAYGCISNWPQFWSRQESWGPSEIDQMESLHGSGKTWGVPCYHNFPHAPFEDKNRGGCVETIGPGWHKFASDWEPGQPMKFYYDDKLVGEEPWEDQELKYLENQSLIAGYLEPEPNRSPLVPGAEALVDYVRLWQHGKPEVATNPAVEVTTTGAKLNGWVNPLGLSSNYFFEYGKTTSYGNTYPAPPGWSVGSGTSNVFAWNNISGLQPGTTYHYRIAAANGLGTSYGADQTFRTLETPRVFYVDGAKGNTINYWSFNSSTGWQQQPFWGDAVAAGTSPSAVMINGTPHVFYVDATKGNTIADWSWNSSTGWQQQFLWGDSVAAGTSPTAVMVNGTPQVFFVDAAKGNTIANWYWEASTGWHQQALFGDSVAAGTSPSAVTVNGTAQVFFVDSAKGNTIANWSWSSTGWQQQSFYGDNVTAGTSPSATLVNNTAQVFFVDAAKGNTIANWYWEASSGWHQQAFFGDSVASGASPSAVTINNTAQVFFVDAAKGNTIANWYWEASSGWHQQALFGHAVAAGTSPSTLGSGGTPHVFYVDATNGKTITDWSWNSSIGWQQQFLWGDVAAANSSPSSSS